MARWQSSLCVVTMALIQVSQSHLFEDEVCSIEWQCFYYKTMHRNGYLDRHGRENRYTSPYVRNWSHGILDCHGKFVTNVCVVRLASPV